MPHTLIPHPFTTAKHHEVESFECGGEPWEEAAANWIKGVGVSQSMARGTKVWLYTKSDATLVGFGSVGESRWRWPDLNSDFVNFSIIPQLAVHSHFQGQPVDVPKDERFSSQIMTHLLNETNAHNTLYVGLEVHEGNVRAIRLYQSYGFAISPVPRIKNFGAENQVYRVMVLRKA